MKFRPRLFLCILGCSSLLSAAEDLFDRSNLAAWCIVPFDSAKRGPEDRAAMLERLGITQFVYDYRAEHVPQWDEELEALARHNIDLLGWWFPGTLNDEARDALDLFQRHGVTPQLWVTGNGGTLPVKDAADQAQRLAAEVTRLAPICEAAAKAGCKVGLYNHGSWFGEPENALAIIDGLKKEGHDHVGMIYNFHHGHSHLDRIAEVLPKMVPYLLCVNLNGMDREADQHGRKIIPLGAGTEDLWLLRLLRASGYHGPVGLLNHTDEDAEARLLDNLDGLAWLLPQLDDATPGPRPAWRSWSEANVTPPRPNSSSAQTAPSLSAEFGNALASPLVLAGKPEYRELPITIECRAKLDRKDRFNILVASEPKASPSHWEIYSFSKTGSFSIYLPGRGGIYTSNTDIADGKWHDLLASVGDGFVRLWVDGKMIHEEASREEAQPGIATDNTADQLIAFGGLVEGGIGCDGLVDDVRLSRGVMRPRKGGHPRLRMDNTIALWSFDDLEKETGVAAAPAPAEFAPTLPPLRPEDNPSWQAEVNRERIFDYYAKQAGAFRGVNPPPALLPAFPGLDGGRQGHWGNQNDQATWKDDRFAKSGLTPVLATVFRGAGLTIPKGVCVRSGDQSACFDPVSCTFRVRWTGGFLRLSDARHGFMGGGELEGTALESNEIDAPVNPRYLGYFRHEDDVIFSYHEEGKERLATLRSDLGDLAALTKGGPTKWPDWLETKGTIGTQKPFATDTLTIPFDNPYGTLFFLTGHDFFADGSAAISTMTGEVWLVRGIDEELGTLRWKRFATGLHQPLGLKIVDGLIYVLGRDQITCLRDLNHDDEADFYENVSNALTTSPGGHDFIVGLERDSQGRWLTASGNQGICRVDATKQIPAAVEVLATGFRNPNGLGLSPDGRFITTSVQEGDWAPASSICQVELGANEGAFFGAGGPKPGQTVAKPMLYLPRGEDNSCSSQAFVTGEAWKDLAGEGNFIHLSSGGGSAWFVMRQQVAGQWQASALRLSQAFASGVQAIRFHPTDGQCYITGMQGWGTYTPDDGCFQRLRYVGGEAGIPVGWEARNNGILLRFASAVKPDPAVAPFAQCWNYHYSAAYGSPEYSLRYSDTPGHDPLEVRSVQVLDGGKALFVEIPQLSPAGQVHLSIPLKSEFEEVPTVELFATVHALAPAFVDFPGYTAIPKAVPHATVSATPTAPTRPNPWADGEIGRALLVEAGLGLQYVQKELVVKAGERLSLTFRNPDVVPHNWLLGRIGSLASLTEKANLMIGDPEGLAKHYVPDSDEVIVYTDMTQPQQSHTIRFSAPAEKGEYPYLCTFPGHSMVMRGVMRVE